MAKKFLLSDISHITKKHSGKYLSNFTNDTGILIWSFNRCCCNLI
jgi:hypothetical protein